MTRDALLSGAQWTRIEPLRPCSDGRRSRPIRDPRQLVVGIIYRFRTGIVAGSPGMSGAVADAVKRYKQFSVDGTWDRIHAALLGRADASG
jgi:transposase